MWIKRLKWMSIVALTGCAPTVPQELVNAREAYARASQGPAPNVAAAELQQAAQALAMAEGQFAERPRAQRTRDLAYVAERRSEYAESAAASELDRLRREKLVNEQLSLVEQRNKALQARVAKLGRVTVEPRGTVITFTDHVLFPFDDATLPDESEQRLSKLAEGLMATKERELVIEGHTDAIGDQAYNVELSQKRADAVKAYLVKQGYDPARIVSSGVGEARPLAPNDSTENRATNRRVEIIIVQPKNK